MGGQVLVILLSHTCVLAEGKQIGHGWTGDHSNNKRQSLHCLCPAFVSVRTLSLKVRTCLDLHSNNVVLSPKDRIGQTLIVLTDMEKDLAKIIKVFNQKALQKSFKFSIPHIVHTPLIRKRNIKISSLVWNAFLGENIRLNCLYLPLGF
jgi:hypothetical protein